MATIRLDSARFDLELAKRGLDAKDLCQLSGIDKSTVSRARRGGLIRQQTATRLIHALLTQPRVPGADLMLEGDHPLAVHVRKA